MGIRECKLPPWAHWVYFGTVSACTIIILALSLTLGKDKAYPEKWGSFWFVNMTRDMTNLDGYVRHILDIIDDANESINIISHKINFTSNFTHLFDPDPPAEIIDTSEPNSFLHKEGQILQAFKRAMDDRKVKVRIITQNLSNTNCPFFRYKGVSFRIFAPDDQDVLLNELITGDSKKILISSTLFESTSFGFSRVVSVRFHYGPIIANDVERFFEVSWKQLDPEERKTIPPIARFWEHSVEARTTMKNPYELENGASVFIAQSKQDILPPKRDDAMDVTSSMLKGAKKRILLSASFFNLENNLFFKNSLALAAQKGVPVRILLSHVAKTTSFSSMMKQAAMIAPLPGIDLRICNEGVGVPNYMVVDDYLLFASGPVAGALYGNSLGIAMVIKQSNLTDAFEGVFDEDCIESEPFHKYLTVAYPKQM